MALGAAPDQVVGVLRALERGGVLVWLAGGWAVDALLGQVTRPHLDIDVRILPEQVARFSELLMDRGLDLQTRTEGGVIACGSGLVVTSTWCGHGQSAPLSHPRIGIPCSWQPLGRIDGAAVRCLSWAGVYLDYLFMEQVVPRRFWRPKDMVGLAHAHRALGQVGREALQDHLQRYGMTGRRAR